VEFRDEENQEFVIETQGTEDVHATAGIWIAASQDCITVTE
jgi:hypothetical protein